MTARNRRQIDRDCGAVLFSYIKIRKQYVILLFFFGVEFSVRVSLRIFCFQRYISSRRYMRNYICLYDFHTLLVQIHGHMGGQAYHAWAHAMRAGPGPGPHGMSPCMVNLPTHAQARYGNHINIYNSAYIFEMYF